MLLVPKSFNINIIIRFAFSITLQIKEMDTYWTLFFVKIASNFQPRVEIDLEPRPLKGKKITS